jgi:hypothetical protein
MRNGSSTCAQRVVKFAAGSRRMQAGVFQQQWYGAGGMAAQGDTLRVKGAQSTGTKPN